MPTPSGYTYGSRHQLGRWIAERPADLQVQLHEACPTLADFATGPLEWIAPTGPDDRRELRDEFWAEVGLDGLSPQDAKWWPARGPVWDAVARVPGPDGQVGGVVVEAKGRAGEIVSGGCKASGASFERIRSAFADVQASLGVPSNPTWLRAYYQMANRLAYLWFARRYGDERPLWLVWIYFTGERYPTAAGFSVGPATQSEWSPAIQAAKDDLHLPVEHDLSGFEATVFLPALVP
jgi:hypothetical protein